MPRGFSDYEKQVITNSLIEEGKILFSKFGLQKTNINEITKNVGIASGTFYKFYNSKEELYFEVLEKEEDQLKKQFISVDIHKGNQPKEAIKGLLRRIQFTIETNPLIRQLYFENNMDELLRKLPPERLEKHFNNDSASLLPLIEKWEMEGIFLDEKPEVIAGILRSLFVLTFHQKEIGETVYQETIEFFISLIVDGLVIEED